MAGTGGSGKVTPEQRGHFQPQTQDGSWAAAWTPPDTVENAHDQQAAPTHAYEAPLNDNAQHLTPAPVADRADPA